jgi:hypothetical protein
MGLFSRAASALAADAATLGLPSIPSAAISATAGLNVSLTSVLTNMLSAVIAVAIAVAAALLYVFDPTPAHHAIAYVGIFGGVAIAGLVMYEHYRQTAIANANTLALKASITPVAPAPAITGAPPAAPAPVALPIPASSGSGLTSPALPVAVS